MPRTKRRKPKPLREVIRDSLPTVKSERLRAWLERLLNGEHWEGGDTPRREQATGTRR